MISLYKRFENTLILKPRPVFNSCTCILTFIFMQFGFWAHSIELGGGRHCKAWHPNERRSYSVPRLRTNAVPLFSSNRICLKRAILVQNCESFWLRHLAPWEGRNRVHFLYTKNKFNTRYVEIFYSFLMQYNRLILIASFHWLQLRTSST